MSEESGRLEFAITMACGRVSLLVGSLMLLRGGARDLALNGFERDRDCENVVKACDYLKRRQRPLALAALETELDQRVVALGRLVAQAKPQEREDVPVALRLARDYRRENPRRHEADLGYFDEQSLALTSALWNEAEKILNEAL